MKKKEKMVKNKSRRNKNKFDLGIVSHIPSKSKTRTKKHTMRFIRKLGFGPAQGLGE